MQFSGSLGYPFYWGLASSATEQTEISVESLNCWSLKENPEVRKMNAGKEIFVGLLQASDYFQQNYKRILFLNILKLVELIPKKGPGYNTKLHPGERFQFCSSSEIRATITLRSTLTQCVVIVRIPCMGLRDLFEIMFKMILNYIGS